MSRFNRLNGFVYALLFVSSLPVPLRHPSSSPRFISVFEQTSITTAVNPAGRRKWFCVNSMLSDFPQRWTSHLCHEWLAWSLLLLMVATVGELKINPSASSYSDEASLQHDNGASRQRSIKSTLCTAEWPSDNLSILVHREPVGRWRL